jgi:hypothetical protein
VLHKSKILLRHWIHTWQKKNHQEEQNSETQIPQLVQSFSMPHYIEKTGGLPCSQMPAPNLLGRCRPTGEQISGMWYSTATPGINQHSPLDRLTSIPQKKNLDNEQRTEKNTQQRGQGTLSAPEKGRWARSWTPHNHSVNKAWRSWWPTSCCTGEGGRARRWTLHKLSVTKSWKGRQADNKRMMSHCLK